MIALWRSGVQQLFGSIEEVHAEQRELKLWTWQDVKSEEAKKKGEGRGEKMATRGISLGFDYANNTIPDTKGGLSLLNYN